MKRSWALVLGGMLMVGGVVAAEIESAVESADLLPPVILKKRILGKTTSVESRATLISSSSGVSTILATTFIGRPSSLVEMQAIVDPVGNDLARTNLYVHGIKIWGGSLQYGQGGLHYTGGIAPTQIPFPIFAYPMGPVLLKVDAGIEFEGKLDAALVPGFSIPITDSTLQAKLGGTVAASGFVEGYGSLYLARAGIEGRVGLIEGESGVDASLTFNHERPQAKAFGKVTFFRGLIEGFVDVHFSFLRWRRILSRQILSWPGKCFAFGSESCR